MLHLKQQLKTYIYKIILFQKTVNLFISYEDTQINIFNSYIE